MKVLRPYQIENVAELLKHNSHGDFSEQRTGKSPTAVKTMASRCSRFIIVCTKSMLYAWAGTVKDFSGHTPLVYTGTKKQRENILELFKEPDSVLIISYGLFKKTKLSDGLVTYLMKAKPDGIVIDEAHRMAGRKTSNFNSLRKTVKLLYRLYLTGTPAPNHPAQVWSILTMIEPKEFSSYWRFVEEFFIIDEVRLPEYVARTTGQRTHPEPSGFLPGKADDYVKLLDTYSIMRKRKEVMPWLPIQEDPVRIALPLTTKQRAYLKELEDFFTAGTVVAQGILDQVLRYRQICLDPRILGFPDKGPKTEWLKDYLDDYPDKQVIIFSRFTQYIRIVEKELGVGVIVGETNPKVRQALITDFQDGMLKVLMIQIDAGKEGITLDNADTLIFTDVCPPASDITQARDRIVATNETMNKPKEIIELMMADSYDEIIYDIVDGRIADTDIANNYIHYLKGGTNGKF